MTKSLKKMDEPTVWKKVCICSKPFWSLSISKSKKSFCFWTKRIFWSRKSRVDELLSANIFRPSMVNLDGKILSMRLLGNFHPLCFIRFQMGGSGQWLRRYFRILGGTVSGTRWSTTRNPCRTHLRYWHRKHFPNQCQCTKYHLEKHLEPNWNKLEAPTINRVIANVGFPAFEVIFVCGFFYDFHCSCPRFGQRFFSQPEIKPID